MTILDDLFGSFVDDVHLEAERSGEPVNERHLASIRRARALTQQVEETVQVLTSPPAADPPQTTPPAACTSPASERSGAPSAA